MITAISIALLLIASMGYFIAKKRYVIAAACLLAFVPAAYAAAYFSFLATLPTRITACAAGQELKDCPDLKADMSYDTGDGVFSIRRLFLVDGTSVAMRACELENVKRYAQCQDAEGATWTLVAYWR